MMLDVVAPGKTVSCLLIRLKHRLQQIQMQIDINTTTTKFVNFLLFRIFNNNNNNKKRENIIRCRVVTTSILKYRTCPSCNRIDSVASGHTAKCNTLASYTCHNMHIGIRFQNDTRYLHRNRIRSWIQNLHQ